MGETSIVAVEGCEEREVKMRWLASAIFRATPPRVMDTAPGEVDCRQRAVSPVVVAVTCAEMSIAEDPTIINLAGGYVHISINAATRRAI
jgi:hypothetical protein